MMPLLLNILSLSDLLLVLLHVLQHIINSQTKSTPEGACMVRMPWKLRLAAMQHGCLVMAVQERACTVPISFRCGSCYFNCCSC